MFQIDLTSSGELQLILPGGRALEIQASVGGLQYLKKILLDHHQQVRNQRGYIGTLPTQHAVDKHFADNFLAEKRKKAAESAGQDNKVKAGKLDIDWDKLEINL